MKAGRVVLLICPGSYGGSEKQVRVLGRHATDHGLGRVVALAYTVEDAVCTVEVGTANVLLAVAAAEVPEVAQRRVAEAGGRCVLIIQPRRRAEVDGLVERARRMGLSDEQITTLLGAPIPPETEESSASRANPTRFHQSQHAPRVEADPQRRTQRINSSAHPRRNGADQ